MIAILAMALLFEVTQAGPLFEWVLGAHSSSIELPLAGEPIDVPLGALLALSVVALEALFGGVVLELLGVTRFLPAFEMSMRARAAAVASFTFLVIGLAGLQGTLAGMRGYLTYREEQEMPSESSDAVLLGGLEMPLGDGSGERAGAVGAVPVRPSTGAAAPTVAQVVPVSSGGASGSDGAEVNVEATGGEPAALPAMSIEAYARTLVPAALALIVPIGASLAGAGVYFTAAHALGVLFWVPLFTLWIAGWIMSHLIGAVGSVEQLAQRAIELVAALGDTMLLRRRFDEPVAEAPQTETAAAAAPASEPGSLPPDAEGPSCSWSPNRRGAADEPRGAVTSFAQVSASEDGDVIAEQSEEMERLRDSLRDFQRREDDARYRAETDPFGVCATPADSASDVRPGESSSDERARGIE
ncbi:MAG: hypothetical protein FJW96_03240 [Actinobacteria bacterium]|nr:hypothetical protein [Actinomycetota bacterium]